jgi:hypothetical protein
MNVTLTGAGVGVMLAALSSPPQAEIAAVKSKRAVTGISQRRMGDS